MATRTLDRQSPMPLWAQLEEILRSQLEAGEFDDGFPTDLELTTTYDVSRHTVREAVRHLNKAGVLTRQRGRGTIVNRSEFEQSLGTLYSLFDAVESSGVEQTSQLLQLATTTDARAATELDLAEDAQLIMIERLRLAGGKPLAIDRTWLPFEIGGALLSVDWSHTALYTELERAGQPVPNEGWERLTPIVPSAPDRQRLDLKRGEAAFQLERHGRRDGTPIEWRITTIRGDRFRFVARWTVGGPSQLVPTAD